MGFLATLKAWMDGYTFQNGQFVRQWSTTETDSGEPIDQASSMQVISVLRCATLIAGAAASLPIDVLEKRGGMRKPVDGHAAELLLDSTPNEEMSSMDFRAQQWLSFLLWGNSYAHIVRNGSRPLALWPLFPQYMEVGREESTKQLVYKYSIPGKDAVKYAPSDILHVRWYSWDGLIGMSAIEQARNGVGLHRATEKSASKLFKNGMQVNLQLEIPAVLTDKQVAQVRKAATESHGGSDNAYRLAIAAGGSKFSPISVNPKDAQFLEQRGYNDVQIAMLFGVPPHMIGLTEKSTSWGTGIAEQKQGFLDFTIAPLLTFHEKAYERCLLSKGEGARYIKHNTAAFLRADVKARFDAYAIAVDKGIYSRNEVRALEEKNPCEGGDIHTVQSQMIPLDQVGKQPPKIQPAPMQPKPGGDND